MVASMDMGPDEMVAGVAKLATFPEVALRVDEAVSADEVDASKVSEIVQTDPALTAALLRLANSAVYQTRGTIDSVDRAVMTVGFRELRDMVFAVAATSTFKGIPNALISVEDFWRHSLYCAVAAQQLERLAAKVRVDSAFTKGLLHDIGHLVMFNQSPTLSRSALEVSLEDNDGLSPHLSEKEVFGFDHAEVGATLAEEWQFPEGLQAAIRFHHAPNSAGPLLINVANSVAVMAELDSDADEDAPELTDESLDTLGIDRSAIPSILVATRHQVEDLVRIFVN